MGIHSEERLIRDGDGAFLASHGSAKMLSEGREVELMTDDWEGSKEAVYVGIWAKNVQAEETASTESPRKEHAWCV